MTDALTRFHEQWLGMVQPVEGLVVSVPVLVDAGVSRPDDAQAALQQRLVALAPPATLPERSDDTGARDHRIADLPAFFSELLALTPDLFDTGDAIPSALSLYVPEGRQTIRPTHALRRIPPAPAPASPAPAENAPASPDATPASLAAAPYLALVWDLADPSVAAEHGVALPLDAPETRTGPWDYPPAAKLDRLLRHARVPIGLLTNREVVRLVYAPHGESSGHITFRMADMASVGGRPILDAFVGLLSATRIFGVAEEHALPALLPRAASAKRTSRTSSPSRSSTRSRSSSPASSPPPSATPRRRDLPRRARARMGWGGRRRRPGIPRTGRPRLPRPPHRAPPPRLPSLRRGPRPAPGRPRPLRRAPLGPRLFAARLQEDRGAHPDAMSRRFGAWARLVALFRTVYLGAAHGDFVLPARRGALFDPHVYPFLEGWGPAGSAPITQPEARADVHVPPIDDDTIARVLDKLLVFEGQRLCYRTLDVEQIGSVYEALMGYHVERVDDAAVCMSPNGVWVNGATCSVSRRSRCRAKYLEDTVGLSKSQADKLASRLTELGAGPGVSTRASPVGAGGTTDAVIDVLMTHARGGRRRDPAAVVAKPGRLVVQPGPERRRTSSHYTPRSAHRADRRAAPSSRCSRAWARRPLSERHPRAEDLRPRHGQRRLPGRSLPLPRRPPRRRVDARGTLEEIAKQAPNEDPLLHARRLVAQRCLYGVDKNDAAVELAKLSLWLVTLAKDLPFTFLDHALRHGDSLVGLDFDQIRHFHWKPEKQLELTHQILDEALGEAIAIRQRIHELAEDGTPEAQREKERLARDAEDASDRARLVADVCVGAFFAEAKDKAREKERARRLDVIQRWNAGDESAEDELRAMQAEIRARLPVFHWMLEYPEVFYAERPDPLEDGAVNRAAYMDAFVGNPPFAGKNQIAEQYEAVPIQEWFSPATEAVRDEATRGAAPEIAWRAFEEATAVIDLLADVVEPAPADPNAFLRAAQWVRETLDDDDYRALDDARMRDLR